MPDQRSVMKEYRYLDEKRLAEGLSPAEQARLDKLRVLVGPETGAGSMKPGFDVNAAAAALRESLLPAGLRNRPPPTPVQAPPAPEPEPAASSLHDAVAAEYAESPFASLDSGAEPPHDALFEPSSLGTEPPPYDPGAQTYDPNAPYDPGAQPYDPNANPVDAGYDPNAPQQAWDPNQPWDPNAAPQDAAAYPADAAYDPNAPQQAWDPNQPWDPNAAPAEAGAYADAAYAAGEGQPQAWDPNQPWDPNAAPQDAAAYPADAASDPNAPQQTWDPNQPWDPNAAPAEGAPPEAGAYADAAYGAGAPASQSWDAAGADTDAGSEEVTSLSADELTEVEAVPGEAAPPEGGSFDAGDTGTAEGWDAAPAQPALLQDAPFGEYDAAGNVEPFAAGTLGAEPPLDASVFGARVADESARAAPAAPELGEYDDTAGFATEPFDASSVPSDAPGLDAADAPELDASWQPEAALDGGFELASGGSFGAGADAAAPEWAQSSAPPPWEGTPPLDLESAPAEQAAEEPSEYEISPAPTSETFGTPAPADLFGAPEGDLAAPVDETVAGGGVAPELDFSHPDFSGGEDADAIEPQADLAAGSFAASAVTAEQVDLSAAPPLDLGDGHAAEASWDAGAPGEPLELGGEPGLPELPPPPEEPPIPELAAPEETILEATDVIEELPAGELAASEVAPELLATEAMEQAPADGLAEFADAAPEQALADGFAEAAPELPIADGFAEAVPEQALAGEFAEAAPEQALADGFAEAAPELPIAGEFAEAAAELPIADGFAEPAPELPIAGEFVEPAPEQAPADEITQFAEAAAAAVASESTDLADVIEAPAAEAVQGAPPVDDFAFDVAEETPPEHAAGEPSFAAATAIAGTEPAEAQPAPEELAEPAQGGAAALEPLPPEPGDEDVTFDLSEEPPAPADVPPADTAEPSPLDAAYEAASTAPAPAAEEEIPTIDGADILEEIVEDGAPAAPPQSLEFEPLEPEPAPAAPAAVVAAPVIAPPAPAVITAPPPPAAVVAPAPPRTPAAAIAPPPPPPPAPAPVGAAPAFDSRVPGTHRVVVHTVEGLVKRGVLDDPELDTPSLALAPQPGGAPEDILTEKVKAIFFMLSPGEKAPAAEGKRVRVTFRDGRQIAGFSPDYQEDGIGFFMIPADTKTNTGRIWVYRAAVRQVAVS